MAINDIHTCTRCGWLWRQRKARDPVRCPNPVCRSPYWMRPRDPVPLPPDAPGPGPKREART